MLESNDFAKIFYHPVVGQILVLNEENEDGHPAILFKFKPDSLGVCATKMVFKDTEEGASICDRVFNEVDESKAVDLVTSAYLKLKETGFLK